MIRDIMDVKANNDFTLEWEMGKFTITICRLFTQKVGKYGLRMGHWNGLRGFPSTVILWQEMGG